jgi:hypothetical protein
MPDGRRNERSEALAPPLESTCPAVSCDAGDLGEVQINYPQRVGTRPDVRSCPFSVRIIQTGLSGATNVVSTGR